MPASRHNDRVLTLAPQDVDRLADMQRLMGQLLFGQLRALGLFAPTHQVAATWSGQIDVPAGAERWLDSSVRALASEGYVLVANGSCTAGEGTVPDLASLWGEWDTRMSEWLDDPHLRARAKLVDAALRALPDILAGTRKATDIIFPHSSLALVEGVYKHNRVADYFNAVLADAVVALVQARRQQEPDARIRIIEIGAGTGGTSEAVFQRLAPHEDAIAEYCYTDVSRAFLMHAEEAYGPTTPYLTYRLLNIEQPLEPQGMVSGAYDVVIAANVLHATKNIRNTLRNAKALLGKSGTLLLNEALGHTLFTHLTFGLLEGWWLYEDVALRIPGTPTLSPETWQRVLEGEGFGAVRFSVPQSHQYGQQIIVAVSDGVIRQSQAAAHDTAPPKAAVAPTRVAATTRDKAAERPLPLLPGEGDRSLLREKATLALKKVVSAALKLPLHEIEAAEPLETYGIDSILVLRLVDSLSRVFPDVTSTLFFEYRSVDALVEHFLEAETQAVMRWVGVAELVPSEAPAVAEAEADHESAPSVAQPVSRRRTGSRFAATPVPETTPERTEVTRLEMEDIAIIGLSGRYPGAPDLDTYWQNLRDGKDSIIEVPQERWDWREYYSDDRSESGRHYSNRGGFITGVDEFDPLFFNISPKEARTLDPQERLFLQHAWMAVEDAGYTRASLQVPYAHDLPGQVGVYVGVMYTEYQLFGAEESLHGNRMGIAGTAASVANRVSSVLNLHGPSVTMDTMCSSSLTAIHFACQDLKLGRTSVAIAGGVNVSVHPNKYLLLSAGQFLSSDGQCRSFGEGGDGFIPGEGVGVIVLKRLSDAVRDHDHIYGIIRGSSVNHGGKTNGYTVPNPQAQTAAIGRALAESHIDARHISFIEAHGTGTKLGDPIEIAALSKAFAHYTPDTEFCRIGSVKSNIGHCESAAGIAGLTKVLLQMEHRQIVPSLHSAELNPHIDFTRSPFVVNQSLTDWEPPVVAGRILPRIAGISSFGAGGSNAHVIVEEYQPPALLPAAVPNVVIVLSARTAGQLQQKAGDLLAFLRPRSSTIDLVSMAYTLHVGREAMEERLGFVVGSAAQLAERLQAYLAGEQDIEDVYQGQVKRNKEALSLFGTDADLQQTIGKWIAGRKLSKLLELWVKGLELDWTALYSEAEPRRMSLPTYPFAKEHYWIDRTARQPVAASATAAAVLHPLLHDNTSDLYQQSYRSTFRGDELFVEGHQLLVAGYLEMARAAVQNAGRAPQGGTVELREVVWAQPLVVHAGTDVDIALFTGDGDRIDFEISSREGEREIIHCQGRAVVRGQAVPVTIDLGALGQQAGPDQWLAELRLPSAAAATSGDYVLHPLLLHDALSACQEWIARSSGTAGQAWSPLAIESIRITAACTPEMTAWMRYSDRGEEGRGEVKLDVDLCDARGHICAELRGVTWRLAVIAAVEQPGSETLPPPQVIAPAAPVRREIVLVAEPRVLPASGARPRPGAISLRAPSAVPAPAAQTVRLSSPGRAAITLSTGGHASAGAPVRLYDDGNGMFTIRVTAAGDALPYLLQALGAARQEPSLAVLLLDGIERCFPRGDRQEFNDAFARGLFPALASFPCPVIATLPDGAAGAGFLAAALCDFMVCAEEASYRVTDAHARFWPTTPEALLLAERFGSARAQDFLYVSTISTGSELRAKGWTCPIVPASEVEQEARKLASSLAGKSRATLLLLKPHLMRRLAGLAGALTLVDASQPVVEAPPAAISIASPAAHIRLDTPLENVLVIHFCMDGASVGAGELVADLSAVFARLQQDAGYRAVVLVSGHADFVAGAQQGIDESAVLAFRRLIMESQVPVVAAVEGDANGDAWLLVQFCDEVVYSRTGVYSAAGIGQSPAVAHLAAAVLAHRFGNAAGNEVLLTGADHSADELRQRAGTVIVAEPGQTMAAALRVAASWSGMPRATLVAWKEQTAAAIQAKIDDAPAAEGEQHEETSVGPAAARQIELRSRVVTVTAHPGGVVVLRMEDRDAKNMFSAALIEGVTEAFAHIDESTEYKVVILTGYDQYFASGGTKEDLLAIQAGTVQFTDTKIYQLPLDCRLPVIAAMQGHGIGGGWSMGMFADLVLLSEESRYVSPYMDYGFTPGAGATLVLAEKIGHDLARESLLTAQPSTGGALKARGLRLPVLPRAAVLAAALAMAGRIARLPRRRLIALKRQWTASVRERLEETYRRELAMHDQTFVGQSAALARIQANFHHESPLPARQVPAAPAASSVPPETLSAITATLKTLLAAELQVRESDIDNDVQFVELGLDSISGVSWIRKVNGTYQTSIEATKVYAFPTLTQLSRYIKEEIDRQAPAVAAEPVVVPPVVAPPPASSIAPDALPAVAATIKTLLANELLMQASDIDEHAQFVDMGLDSISGVSWMRRINEKYGTSIEATRIYSYPTLAQLSRYVASEAERRGAPVVPDVAALPVSAPILPAVSRNRPVPAPSTAPPHTPVTLTSWRGRTTSRFAAAPAARSSEPIAVIGMAGQFPQARNVDEFWNNIAEGRNSITEVSPDRWDVDAYYRPGTPAPGKTNSHWLGALEEYDLFDPLFFNISPTEAESMDPQQRLFLQECWHAIENAGYDARVLSGSKCGVFVGCATGDYHQLSREHQLSAQGFTGSATSILAARISYLLNLQGPCISIDTACSSSLVAIAEACDSLVAGDSDLALAGGVCVLVGPDMHIKTSQAGMLSPTGRCFTFDQRADGFVPGEGVGVVMLKRLSDAQRDRDIIHGVIQGWGVNQDGKTNGITAPNPDSQTRIEQHVYDKYGIDPANIALIEAHGTGTKLGDPIEVDGLKQAFARYTQNKAYCALGSVKSNIGHTLTASGVAGVLKLLLALRHKQLPPTINFERLNEHIALADSPFYVNRELRDWTPAGTGTRQAAVSAFGFSGTNAHLVVGEYLAQAGAEPPVTVVTQNGRMIVPLSARTEPQLRQKAHDLLAAIRTQPSIGLLELAYTLQAGREPMAERLGLLVGSVEELTEKLEAYVDGQTGIPDLYQGQVKRSKESMSVISQEDDVKDAIVSRWIAGRELSKLLNLWVKGLELDWNQLYGEAKPRRVDLPTYPFAKERYWIETAASGPVVPNDITAVLHPLLQTNTSSVSEQRFSTRFTGDEFFLADHVIQGAKLLPGVCYLEMARAAVMTSAAELSADAGAVVRLTDVVWMSPLVVDDPRLVHIAVYADEQGGLEYEIYSGDEPEVIHARGRATFAASGAEEAPLDWQALLAACETTMTGAACYATFRGLGMEYGPAQQGIRGIGVGSDAAGERYALAEVELPANLDATSSQYWLHPSVMDSALQAMLALLPADKPIVPFALDAIEILDRSPAHAYVYIRESADGRGSDPAEATQIPKVDLDVCDANGHVCARLHGLTARYVKRDLLETTSIAPAVDDPSRAVQLVPRWDAVTPPATATWPATDAHILLVGGNAAQQQAIRARFPNVRVAEPGHEEAITDTAIEQVIWLTPLSDATDPADERLLSEQSRGVLAGFALIRTLLRLGYDAKALGWTVVTWQTQAVAPHEEIRPAHASVHGLIGSLAKEYARWTVRLVDLPVAGEWPLDELLALPADARGDAWAYRDGEWYRQQLVPCDLPAVASSTYRDGGVYVVIGGAGGVGEAFSEYLIRNYRAQMVWIGRRPLDAEIQVKLDWLASFGPAPTYLRADATDREALAHAYEQITVRHGRIHGVVHAAIALFDQSLAQMDEKRFRASLTAKADVSVRLAQVFAHAELDFVLFFSSLASFAKSAGQSNYSAGSTFEDALAHQLSRSWPCAVKTMNWGFWGTRGAVASAAYRGQMAQRGVGSIEAEEGMAALEQLLAAPLPQMGLFKGDAGARQAMNLSHDRITIAERPLPSLVEHLAARTERAFTAERNPQDTKDLQRLTVQLLFDQLQMLRAFDDAGTSITAWKRKVNVPARYDRWLDESLRILAAEGFLTLANDRWTLLQRRMPERGATWAEWEAKKAAWRNVPALGAQVKLVDATLRALPEILTGRRPATDVLFPGASMSLVEGIYKHNPVADYFNAVLADAVVELVEARRRQQPDARMRIIEIGAGTGGASEGVFQRLRPYQDSIGEYCYTDLSKAFLMHAEQAYGPATPYLTYRVLDIEQPLAPQGIVPGSFDLAIAVNVLHATKNIRQTLRNVKAALARNGVLLLNELVGHSVTGHLTFGLLEGWWAYDDASLRFPGTPSLDAATWQRVLEREGFDGVRFPASASHAHGQQIVAAASDGVIRQRHEAARNVAIPPRAIAPLPAKPAHAIAAAASTPVDPDRLRSRATVSLKKIVSETVRVPLDQIDSSEELETYGIDSILVLRMVDALSGVFANIGTTLFFEYRTVDALVEHFLATERAAVERWVGAEAPARSVAAAVHHDAEPAVRPAGRRRRQRPSAAVTAAPAATITDARSEDIAIIGMSGRYPQAIDLDVFWRNLRDGKDSITEVPEERWNWRDYFSEDRAAAGNHHSKWGGFIEGVDEFDPVFFNIAPKEAKHIDPQERLFLQHAWMAVEDAGYTRAGLQQPSGHGLPGQVGVYAGVMYSEYQLFGAESSLQGKRIGITGSLASIANRVSYVLNLHGPSMTVDTMCSSSLTAIHVACQDLKLGRTSMAIAGGVNVSVHPNKYLVLSAGQFFSSGGHCESFGEGGDGFVPGEGVGVVILKRLSDAERDGDHIYGTIRGSALTHGGKTNGYSVPNPEGQASVIGMALAEARVDARHISYIEAHGTGTKLGDPIEIAALSKAFRHDTEDTGFCLVGSVKSNIGHCESAAGVAALTKILLQMRHHEIVPSLHSAQLNPHIDFARSPFVVNQSLRKWEQPVIDGRTLPRIAGISSFGAGGSNAHLIVEEYPLPPVSQPFAPVAIVLSARTAEQLQQKTAELLAFVQSWPGSLDLASMAYTLQTGREPMEERLGFVVSSVEQLIEKLEAWVAGQQGIEDAYHGQVKRNKEALSLFKTDVDLQETIGKWIAHRKLPKLVELWVKGLELDWSALYGETRPRRISLPTYPFAREHYWIDMPPPAQQAAAPAAPPIAAAAVLHPLLHRNTSDFSEQRFRSTFTGDELFLTSHPVNGHAARKVLPVGACLEMARAALVEAMPEQPASTILELHDTVWAEPIAIDGPTDVSIALVANDDGRIEYEIYTRDGDVDVVHCQGSAMAGQEPAPAPLNLAQLRTQQGSRQLVAHLQLPDGVEPAEYVLHPALMDAALQACLPLAGPQRLPASLQTLRIVAPCSREMVAWVRSASGSPTGGAVAMDLDLCDTRGNVAVQLRGLNWQTASVQGTEPVAIPAAEPKAVAFLAQAPAQAAAPARSSRISLAAPTAMLASEEVSRQPSAARPSITLTTATTATTAATRVHLSDHGNGTFTIQVAASGGSEAAGEAIAHLLQALAAVQQDSSARVLTISGLERCFLRGGREDCNAAVDQYLYQALASFPVPIIAALHGDTIGAGFLAAALCDFMVCNEDAAYGFSDARAGLEPTVPETLLFAERFGDVRARHLLYVAAMPTGKELRANGWTCPIVPPSEVEAHAQKLAASLASKAPEALRLLKQHLTRHLPALVNGLTRVEPPIREIATSRATADERVVSPGKHIHLDAPAEDVVLIKLRVTNQPVAANELVADLGRIFAQLHENASCKAIVLVSECGEFLPRAERIADDLMLDLERLIVDSEIPVVIVFAAGATGNAWLIGQFCDACVYSRTDVYSAAGIGQSPALVRMAAASFAHRLGHEASNEILLTGAEYLAADLQRRVGALTVEAHDQALPAAVRIAASWARRSRASLATWKRHNAATLREQIRNLPSGWDGQSDASEPQHVLPSEPTAIALQSTVVTATAHPDGVVVVTMADRDAKNMFSDAFVAGVNEVFAHIDATPSYKVVILTGYDQYFASGGTKENLLAIQAGTARFTDSKIFQLPLDCRLPVIAAMQGHGIGGGWSLGMFADLVLLSEESRYVSPYMDYGFTPGAGATWILAEKIGQDLARESLLTAQAYTGSALKSRGILLSVLPRAAVEAAAMALARQIARMPRSRLIGLKQQLTSYVHAPLEETYRLELAMHERTFVGRTDTLARIESNFHREVESAAASAPPPRAVPATAPVRVDALAAVTASLKTLLAGELQMRESDLDDDTAFVDLGLDSISGVSWVRQINAQYKTSIEATKVYAYPTLAQLGRYVHDEAEQHGLLASFAAPAAEVASVEVPAAVPEAIAPVMTEPRPAAKLPSRRGRKAARVVAAPATVPAIDAAPRVPRPIAIIGMAGQFPRAKNVDEFWQNLAEGRNCITPVAPERWDPDAHYQAGEVVPGKTNSQWFGALDEYDLFDPLFFNISPTEARFMDPQQRVFLQACWHSIENAGYDARLLSGSKCGVFVGCATGDYHQLSRAHQLTALGFTGAATSILAARISYFLNLQGPCVSIDTACSSSLVAMAQACDSLNAGDSDLALAGGVYVMAGPEMHIRTAQAGMLSPTGRCYTFDQRADGFVPGEGVGVVVLKRLSDAERDGDIILGVIDGWGVNQDGKTNGITAPNPESQTRLEQEVYEKYAIDPAGIQLVEAHGTATKMGDPIEIEALKASFARFTQKTQYAALGSVKSNIGHCLTAAGVSGVIKLLLALQHRQLPPSVNFEELNEHIDLTGSPFFVNTRLRAWETGGAEKRRAAISSFGFSGTNAHLVIGEYLPPAGAERTSVPRNMKTIVPLSARTAVQLRQKARDLLVFLRSEEPTPELLDVAHTLQVGRTAMNERLAFVVSSVGELTDKLQAHLDGTRPVDDCYQGDVRGSKDALAPFRNDLDLQETIAKWVASNRLSSLADLWVKGLELDWTKLHGDATPRRIRLPLYPFAKERYWIDTADLDQPAPATAVPHATPRPPAERLFAAPVWQSVPSAAATTHEYAEHLIILCELPRVDGEVLESLLPSSRCLSLHAAAGAHLAQRYSDDAVASFQRIAAILQSKPKAPVLVQLVVAGGEEPSVLAGLSALLETATLENPQFTGQVLLTSPGSTAGELSAHLREEKQHGLDPVVRYDRGARQVLRWEEVDAGEAPKSAYRDDGVYLITGGLGALGLLFASDILARAAGARVVLTGRSPWSANVQARLDALSSEAGRVTYRQVDLADADAVRRLIAGIREEHQQLDGILHCAGMAADNAIVKKDRAEFRQVLAPKVAGTFHLDEATRNIELDFFVLFSSVAGALGNVGQADYATANAFLDHFAVHRNQQVTAGRRHGRTRSINWPLWQAGGMAIDQATQTLVQSATGMQPMQTVTGLDAFHRSLALPHDQLLVLEGARAQLAAYLRKARRFAPTAVPTTAATQPPAIAVSEGELQQRLKALLSSVLGIDPTAIHVDQPFVDFGVDSFLGAQVIVAINQAFGTELSHLRLFDYSTVKEFAQFLAQEVRKLPAPVVEPAPTAARQDEKIAIIGMSGRYPQANDLNQYWENLAEGRNSVFEVPAERWDVTRYYDPDRTKTGTTYSKWLGAVDDVDRFDPLFFRISPQEAEYIDPQHRLFLQESYKAFEDAGYSTATLSNRKCGVYLGISTSEYMSLMARSGVIAAPVTSNSYAIAAARIAYYLNLKGPAISVDTACSSSLVAIHLASQSLLSGEIDMALAGGVSLWLTPESYVSMSQAGMFSPTGQCKTFDDGADGIVNGEGVGALVLKRLSDAERDGDVIYGVILGSGLNQDGRTNGITAPSVNSQIELERGIYARHAIDPESISYIETHGTGTKLGDPIELEAIATVFREQTAKKNFCALGSVKSNIGHTTAAAGVAGIQKVLLSMRHRTLVPSLNVSRENSRFDFANSPFYISRETKPWKVADGSLRRAAVSSFGFSGTNAHLVIEEYPAPVTPAAAPAPVLVPLSARTPEALQQKTRDLLAFLRTAPVDLPALAYTLQTGREAMDERLGFMVSSVDELTEKLSASLNARPAPPAADGSMLDLWLRGNDVDWNRLYPGTPPRRLNLPTYPFARERCWIDESPTPHATDLQSIDEIINQIADDTIDTDDAVHALRLLV